MASLANLAVTHPSCCGTQACKVSSDPFTAECSHACIKFVCLSGCCSPRAWLHLPFRLTCWSTELKRHFAQHLGT